MFTARIIPVLVSSASDVRERNFIDRAISRWNNINRGWRGVMLLPLLWERDVPGIQGADTQAQINRWIVDIAEIGIVVLGEKYGAGHTEGELRRMLEGEKTVIVYQCERESLDEADKKIGEMVNEIRGRGILRRYMTEGQLEDLIFRDLSAAVSDVLGRHISSHLKLGHWLQVKERDAARPYSLVRIAKGDGQWEIGGESFYEDGRRGFRWPRSDSRVFDCGGDRLFHFYMADGGKQLVTGATFYDFPRYAGYYYQSASSGAVPTGRVEFDLHYLSEGAVSGYYGVPSTLGIKWASTLIRRIHLNRVSPRVILTGGPCSGKTSLAEHLMGTGACSSLVRDAECDVLREWKERHVDEYENVRREMGVELQVEIFHRQRQRELAALPANLKAGVRPLLMDRSGVDCLAYASDANEARILTGRSSLLDDRIMLDYASELRKYTYHVFVLDTLGSFDERLNTGRIATREESERMGTRLERLYMDIGFSCTRLREYSAGREKNLEERARRVREVLDDARCYDPFA